MKQPYQSWGTFRSCSPQIWGARGARPKILMSRNDFSDVLSPTHPGEMLLKEFLEPMQITQQALAQAIGVPYQRVI